MIPVFKPSYGPEEYEALREPMASGWVGLGPKTAEFERAFADYVGAAHAVGVNSATSALHLGLALLDIADREVITPSLTFVSTNHAILYNGGIPVFADVDPETLSLDPTSVEEKITDRTAAIMVVDYGGHPAELDQLRALCDKYSIALVEDAAHSCGASFRGRKVGSIADVTCFSFHAVKNLATGEGGMVTVSRVDWDTRLRHLRWLGIDRSTWDRTSGEDTPGGSRYNWQYGVDELGFKAHLSDIPSAIGLVQLQKLDKNNSRRREIAAIYDAAFSDLEWLDTPVVRSHVETSQHNYVVRTRPEWRDRLVDHLAERGVASSVHYYPNHLYSIYAPYRNHVPVTEAEWLRILTLPLFPDLTDDEITQVIESVRSFPV